MEFCQYPIISIYVWKNKESWILKALKSLHASPYPQRDSEREVWFQSASWFRNSICLHLGSALTVEMGFCCFFLFGSTPNFGKSFGHVCGMVDVPFNWITFLANQMLILDRSQSSVHEELWMKSFWRMSGLDSGFLGYHCPPRWTCWSGSCKKEL